MTTQICISGQWVDMKKGTDEHESIFNGLVRMIGDGRLGFGEATQTVQGWIVRLLSN